MNLKTLRAALRTRSALVYLCVTAVPLVLFGAASLDSAADSPLAALPALVLTAPLSFLLVAAGQAVAGTLSDAGYHVLVVLSCAVAGAANAVAVGLLAAAVRSTRSAR
ncbi:hypothetical protein GCM10010124_24290 [Pilimelia terevasa]|uniref:Uncharacterized protein n=1 Tax=Pilimelia terevasa TaxID=53372 RepID=A0A8J3FHU5_9ACTN|nr:hypothetical protein [Pilimelia terevasa]GGK30703.1 hypothetical protein GCM10010124_24290 [Pilimelia terevasa]